MVKNYNRTGWQGESYRHYLAAKGIKTTHNYYVRRKTGMPQSFIVTLPQTTPGPANIERRIYRRSMYDILGDDKESLQKAIKIQDEIDEIERQRAQLERQYTTSQRDKAILLLSGEKEQLEIDLEDAAGNARTDIESRIETIDKQLSGLRQARDPQDVDAGFTSDLDEFAELTKAKSIKEKELTRLLGFQIEGGRFSSASKLSGSEVSKGIAARKADMEVRLSGGSLDSPQAREAVLPLSDIVVPKARSGELIVPSGEARLRAIDTISDEQAKLVRTRRQTPTMKDILPSNDAKDRMSFGLDVPKIPGAMGRSVTLDTSKKKKDDDEDREYMSGRSLFGSGAGD